MFSVVVAVVVVAVVCCHHLFLVSYFQAAIGAAGGIDLVLRAMQAHPNNGGVQENAFAALYILNNHPSNKVQCFSAQINIELS